MNLPERKIMIFCFSCSSKTKHSLGYGLFYEEAEAKKENFIPVNSKDKRYTGIIELSAKTKTPATTFAFKNKNTVSVLSKQKKTTKRWSFFVENKIIFSAIISFLQQ